jgi:hypothetical protein
MAAALAAPLNAARADDDPTIAADIAALGDLKPATRDAAAAALSAMRRSAEPALETAASSDDPEIAERANGLLERLRFGISPGSPPQLVQLLAQYRSGSAAQRMDAVGKLTASDLAGMRIPAGLAHQSAVYCATVPSPGVHRAGSADQHSGAPHPPG